MIEIWKDINEAGYENLYEVSNTGNVRRKNTNRLLKFNLSPFYFQVALSNGNRKCIKVHRLVAKAFIKNLDNKPEVNHIDGNRYNNRVDNLEWVTAKENSNHAYKKGITPKPPTKYGEQSNSSKLTKSKVKEIRDKYKNGAKKSDLSREYKVSDTNISAIVNFKIWIHE